MSKFYVVLAGHDKVSDAGRATTCRCKFKAPSLQIKGTKNIGHFENIDFDWKTIWRIQRKKEQKHYSRPFKKIQSDNRTQKPSIEYRLVNSTNSTKQNLKKFIQIKTVVTLQNYYYEIKSWHVQLLCSLCESWYAQWRWQSNHVQVQIQSSISMNKKYKKWSTYRKHGFQRENNWKISDGKKHF